MKKLREIFPLKDFCTLYKFVHESWAMDLSGTSPEEVQNEKESVLRTEPWEATVIKEWMKGKRKT